MNEELKTDPIARKAIAEFSARYGLSVAIVADQKTFRDHLENSVKEGNMASSTALELYCARLGLPEETVLELAESYAGFDVWAAAEKAIDAAIAADNVAAMLNCVDAEYC